MREIRQPEVTNTFATARESGTYILPFSVSIPDLSLSNTVATTVDAFLFVAGDSTIRTSFFLFDVESTSRGTMTLSLVTSIDQGEYRQLTDPVSVTAPTREPEELGKQADVLSYGRPVYLRVVSRPESGITPWWDVVTRINLSLHMQNLV